MILIHEQNSLIVLSIVDGKGKKKKIIKKNLINLLKLKFILNNTNTEKCL